MFIKNSASDTDYTKTLQNTILDINDVVKEIVDEIFNPLMTIYNFIENLYKIKIEKKFLS